MAVHTQQFPFRRLLHVLLCLAVLAVVPWINRQAHAEVATTYNLDDADPNVAYQGGPWTHVSGVPTALYSTLSWTNAPGSSAAASFNGTTITYFYTMASNFGATYVYLDDILRESFSATAPETRRQVGRTYTLTPGWHNIKVVVGAGGFSDLDAFAVDIASVGIGTYDNGNAQVRYFGAWSDSTFLDGTYGNSLRVTNTNLSGFRFTFSGDRVTYLFSKSTNRGKAAVTIDGVFKGYVDQYAGGLQRQQGVKYSNLGSGPHVLNVVYSGQKNPLSTDTYIDIDAIVVGSVYNRAAAVAYADQWAHGRNPAFPNYGYSWWPTGCNDCTNFVSQVLFAGGVPEIEYINYDDQYFWYVLNLPTGGLLDSRTWSATDWFRDHVNASPWRYQFVGQGFAYPPQLSAGDFIVMDLVEDGLVSPTHVAAFDGYGVVQEGDGVGTSALLRSQHCVDRNRVKWEYNLNPDTHTLWSYHVVY